MRFVDGFDYPNQAGLPAPPWVNGAVTNDIVTNAGEQAAQPVSGSSVVISWWATPTRSDDQFIETDWTTAGTYSAVMLRCQSAPAGGGDSSADFYRFSSTGTNVQIHKVVSGVTTQIGSAAGAPANLVRYIFRAEADGSTLRILVNGVEMLNITDTAIPTGKYVGIRGTNASSRYYAVIGGDLHEFRIPRSAGSTKREVFTASGTWTKDPLAKQVRVTVVGGGGGGGSGRSQAGQNAGGGGGAGGCLSSHVFDAADLTSTVAATVGAGGAGGAGVQTANGAGGAAGGTSSFGSYLRAVGGNAGTGGTSGSGTGGAAATSGATDINVAGGLGEDTIPGVAAANVVGTRAAGSGGGGGGSNTGPTATAGGNGGGSTLLGATGGAGGAAGVANPSDGTAGGPGSTGGLVGGGGGGGGAAMASAAAAGTVSGAGGAGGFPGGGGGGGAAVATGGASLSGAGGAGAHGCVVVEVIY